MLAEHLVSVLNGLAIGSLLFVLAAGLSLVFGTMDVLNLAHGAVYLVGAYLAYALADGGMTWGVLLLALALALAAGAASGAALAGLARPLARRGHLDQALLTLGVALVVADGLSIAFGNDVRTVAAPPGLEGSVEVAGQPYPVYRLALVAVGVAIALGVYVALERTRLGALIRATVADREMIEALGADARKVFVGVFAAGCALAAVAGVLGSQVYGARPGLDETVLILALIVVVVGGLGSIRGALVGAIVIGLVDSLGRSLAPDAASLLLFAAMVVILLVRPGGLARAELGAAR